jgi:hypothetical protein
MGTRNAFLGFVSSTAHPYLQTITVVIITVICAGDQSQSSLTLSSTQPLEFHVLSLMFLIFLLRPFLKDVRCSSKIAMQTDVFLT